jgi:hydroxymethylpyrimidine pyrophosphatase-like HAD family hydrolase
VLIADSVESGESAVSKAKEIDLGDYRLVRSWNTGLEILHKDNMKGVALNRVKEKTGAKISVAVGDYENDIAMLTDADISYAVANACDVVKTVAKRHTSAVTESSLADVIADLEREFCDN